MAEIPKRVQLVKLYDKSVNVNNRAARVPAANSSGKKCVT